jgi:hypothetical protein
MSYREETFMKFKRSELISKLSYIDELSEEEIRNLFHEVLNGGIHGFCFNLVILSPKHRLLVEWKFLANIQNG